MPGLTTCIRCGSVLRADEPIGIDPPRAGVWQKRLRPLVRAWRRLGPSPRPIGDILTRRARSPIPIAELKEALVVLLLSLVPGLLYLMRRRYQALIIGGGSFLFFLLCALLFYGSVLGGLCAGLAVGAHISMILHATGLTRSIKLGRRVVLCLLLAFAVWTLDLRIARLVGQDFIAANTAMPIPAQNIHDGDHLLARRSMRAEPNPLPRGAIVLADLPVLIGYARELRVGPNTARAFGQVIGRPGETVRIQEGRFWVEDTALDPDAYPMVGWMAQQERSVTVGDEAYFINTVYRNQGNVQADRVSDHVFSQLVLVPASSVQARAIMRWLPLRRRGFLTTEP